MYKFAFKNLWLKKTRSGLALLGLAVAIIGVIGLISISGGIRESVTESVAKVQGIYVIKEDSLDPVFSTLPLSYEDDLEKIQGVKAVAPEIWGIITTVEGETTLTQGMMSAVMYIGIEPSKTLKLTDGGVYNQNMKKGRFLRSSDKYSAVISQELADEYKKGVGSSIELIDETKFTIVGIYETGTTFLDMAIIIPMDVARDFADMDSDHVSSFYVDVDNPAQVEAVAAKIQFKLDDIDAKSGSQAAEEFSSLIAQIDVFFVIISSIAIIVGGLGILNMMLMSVMERTREFGILKAIGWTRSNIMQLIVFESLFIGIVGGAIGCILGLAGVLALEPFLPFSPAPTLLLVAAAFLLAVTLSVLGGLYPAWKASKLDPVTAIRAI